MPFGANTSNETQKENPRRGLPSHERLGRCHGEAATKETAETKNNMNRHIPMLYALWFIAFSIALAGAFGERSNYLRLNDLGAPQLTLWDLFR